MRLFFLEYLIQVGTILLDVESCIRVVPASGKYRHIGSEYLRMHMAFAENFQCTHMLSKDFVSLVSFVFDDRFLQCVVLRKSEREVESIGLFIVYLFLENVYKDRMHSLCIVLPTLQVEVDRCKEQRHTDNEDNLLVALHVTPLPGLDHSSVK